MLKAVVMQPWDEAPMRRDLVRVLKRLPRERLDRLTDLPPSTRGIYVQWFATPAVEPILGRLIASAQYPCNIGVAAGRGGLRERIGRYRQSIRGTTLREQDIWIATMPCSSAASALFAESVGLEEVPVPLAGSGFGAKPPGSNRREQSPFDALFPGRRWAAQADLLDQAKARLKVLTWMINLDPGGPRWPALPVAEDGPLATVTPLAGRERGA